MPATRVYVPLTHDDVRALATTRVVGGARVVGYAVTPGLRALTGALDDDDLEYAAFTEAGDAAPVSAGGRTVKRVVVAADVDAMAVTIGEGAATGQVAITGPIPLRRIVSVHIDDEAGATDEEMSWYDVTELDDVVRLLD